MVIVLGISWFKRYPYPNNAFTRVDSHLFFGIFLASSFVGVLLEIMHKKRSHFLITVGDFFEVLIFPSALSATITLSFSVLVVEWHLTSELLSYFVIITFFIGLIPLVYIYMRKAELLAKRIGLVILFDVAFQVSLDQIIILSPAKILHPEILELISDIGFILLIGWLMHWWGYKSPNLLKFGVNSDTQLIVLTGLFLLGFVIIGISTFSTADSWFQFINHWNFKLREVPLLTIIVTMMGSFVEEWEFRYAVLWQLIRHYRNSKNPVIKPVIISSLLFGLAHSFNLSNQQSIEATLLQIVTTFSVGVLFAIIYLCTGRLWTAVLMHGLMDLFGGVLARGASFTEVTPSLYIIELTSLITLIILLVAFYLMFKRFEVMRPTLKDITNEH